MFDEDESGSSYEELYDADEDLLRRIEEAAAGFETEGVGIEVEPVTGAGTEDSDEIQNVLGTGDTDLNLDLCDSDVVDELEDLEVADRSEPLPESVHPWTFIDGPVSDELGSLRGRDRFYTEEFNFGDFEQDPYGAFIAGMVARDMGVGIDIGGEAQARTGYGVLLAEEIRAGNAVRIQYEGSNAGMMQYLDFVPKEDLGEVEVEDGQVRSTGYPMKSRNLEDLDDQEEAYEMIVTDTEDAREIVDQYGKRSGMNRETFDDSEEYFRDISSREFEDDDPVWG